jgi:hypothetical protein
MQCDLSLTHEFNGELEVALAREPDDHLGDFFIEISGKNILNWKVENLSDFGRYIAAYI